MPAIRIEVLPELSAISAAEWDGLLHEDDAPLLSWAYLQGLEQTGCVGEGTGWYPAHLLARGTGGELLGAAPAYLKTDSDGEWVYDLDWAAFAAECGLGYYPKLVLAVPWNPVGGRRVLLHRDLPQEERGPLCTQLLRGAQALCRQAGLSSAHVLFPAEQQTPALSAAGYALRRQEQYHFLNQGYQSFDDFLLRLSGHRRTSIRRERRALLAAGITVRTHGGLLSPERPSGFTLADLDTVFDLYVGTSQRYTGEVPYLTRPFFHLCAERLGERLELVVARDGSGRILGGAFNLRGDRRLYGRYWGEAEHVPFLHFEVCFYHSMERCIALGLSAFEPGHGGEQKLLRGFWPVPTYSAHHFADPALKGPVEAFLRREAPHVQAQLLLAQKRSPLREIPPKAARVP